MTLKKGKGVAVSEPDDPMAITLTIRSGKHAIEEYDEVPNQPSNVERAGDCRHQLAQWSRGHDLPVIGHIEACQGNLRIDHLLEGPSVGDD